MDNNQSFIRHITLLGVVIYQHGKVMSISVKMPDGQYYSSPDIELAYDEIDNIRLLGRRAGAAIAELWEYWEASREK